MAIKEPVTMDEVIKLRNEWLELGDEIKSLKKTLSACPNNNAVAIDIWNKSLAKDEMKDALERGFRCVLQEESK